MKILKVRLSEVAQERLLDILKYVEIEWSTSSKNKFLKKFDEKIQQISQQPKSCPESEDVPGIYKGVVEKHVSFVYRINSDFIDVLTVFDNRQSPQEIKKIISKAHNNT